MTTTPSTPASPDSADPSMEEILASIRRILNDEEAPATDAPLATEESMEEPEDVLILDETMMVAEPESHLARFEAASPEPVAVDADPFESAVVPEPFMPPPEPRQPAVEAEAPARQPDINPPPPTSELLGPEAAAAAASSVGSLVRTLSAGRGTQLFGGGPTLEDMVRAELRPLLKDWLDTYLPPMVERLVRTEIERVVGRGLP